MDIEKMIQEILDERILSDGNNATGWKKYNDGITKAVQVIREYQNASSSMKRYLFWFESEGKNGWTFEIEALNHNDAYDRAYDTHGPQVAGMMYRLL